MSLTITQIEDNFLQAKEQLRLSDGFSSRLDALNNLNYWTDLRRRAIMVNSLISYPPPKKETIVEAYERRVRYLLRGRNTKQAKITSQPNPSEVFNKVNEYFEKQENITNASNETQE